jgi:AcrR family transcriptional regulator
MSDRRRERREQTIDEVVTTALEVMTGAGAAGLSLGEVAKRMGVRTPSLYGYFPSKAALCDEIFARGWRELGEVMQQSREEPTDDAAVQLLQGFTAFVGWAIGHRAHAELMFWRPVPGWEPGPEAFGPALDVLEAMHSSLATMQRRGMLRPDISVQEMGRVVTVLTTGVISQQLSNEPGVPLAQGRFTATLPHLVAMFLHEFGTNETAATRRSNGSRRKVHR